MTMETFQGPRAAAKAMARELALLWDIPEKAAIEGDEDDDFATNARHSSMKSPQKYNNRHHLVGSSSSAGKAKRN